MQATPDTMIGGRWYCPNDVEVIVLVDLNVRILLGIDYPCRYKPNV